ncbi:MAG: amino acid adenylation domain-containing protein, partial [bacterium]|nr:amino acid adenylation domain-containing protein [bacterium]
ATAAQRRLFLLHEIEENHTAYSTTARITFRGSVNADRLEQGFKTLMFRHSILRTGFEPDNFLGILVQEIDENCTIIPEQDEIDTAEELEEQLNSITRPFDLSNPPLFRARLVRQNNSYILLLCFHHIIADNSSITIFLKELIKLYHGENLPPVELSYLDYAEWENETLPRHENFSKLEEYWLEKFSSDIPVLNMPTDLSRPAAQKFRAAEYTRDIEKELENAILQKAEKNNCDVRTLLFTAYTILLHRYTGQREIISGIPAAVRDTPGLRHTMGSLTHTLPVWCSIDDTRETDEFLRSTQDILDEAIAHKYFSHETIIEHIDLPKDTSRNALFDTIFSYTGSKEENRSFSPDVLDYELKQLSLDYDLSFSVLDHELLIRYEESLFTSQSIERMAGHYINILREITGKENKKIFDIDLVSDDEKKQILDNFNNTQAQYPSDKTLHRLFEEQVARTPNNTALIFEGKTMTYKELNEQANRLAHLLRKKGVGPDTMAGIMMERSFEMMIGIFAILKAGGAYLPIAVSYPQDRIEYMLENANVTVLLSKSNYLKDLPFTALLNFEAQDIQIEVTAVRPPIQDFNNLIIPDRSLINLNNYKGKVTMASVTNSIAVQSTRGCPFECIYCHKIWSKKHTIRTAENIFNEVEYYYNQGVRNFSFIDDIFNLNKKNSIRFFELILENKLDIQIFFPNGLRGDALPNDYIDLMVEAGTRLMNLSLETASPRLQKLLKKNINLDKFKTAVDYIAGTYPFVGLELATMHGFPTETEEEALMTLEFIKSVEWFYFPFVHILKIYPNTEMEQFALEHGVSKEAIMRSKDLAYHELPETLPFPKTFTRQYQSRFMNEYILSKDRLRQVLPYQMEIATEEALVQRYDGYLPVAINKIEDVFSIAGIDEYTIPGNFERIGSVSKEKKSLFDEIKIEKKTGSTTKKVLLLDLSYHFSSHEMLYKVSEQPIGLIYLATQAKEKFGDAVDFRIYKSGIDFDSFEELKNLVDTYSPDLVGIRTLTFFKNFFHETVSMLRQWGIRVPIITGGPYATSDYDTILKDTNISLAVMGEGEYTFTELLENMLANDFKIPSPEVLKTIPGIAFTQNPEQADKTRSILLLDEMHGTLNTMSTGNLPDISNEHNLAYIIYTSGSTGKPKGAMLEHHSVVNRINWMQNLYPIDETDVLLQKTPYTFDVSVWELFWWSFQGAALQLLTPGGEKNPDQIAEAISEQKVSVLHFVPSMLQTFLYYLENVSDINKLASLRQVFASGEALLPSQVNTFNRLLLKDNKTKLINLYGPTEAAVDVSYFDCDSNEEIEKVPIGKPVENTYLYVLNSHNGLQPVGIIGELHIGGVQLARGYINNRELTDEKFVNNPFRPGEKMYKTGDLARWLPDGNIEFLGRIDFQVKVRGFRIEPGEIAENLAAHEAIDNAVVLTEKKDGDNELLAYIIPDRKKAPTVLQLITMMRENRVDMKQLHTLPNDIPVFSLNNNETDFMYDDIFKDECYIQHGITLNDGDCVFDIGSNIGLFSVFINNRFNDLNIYSFEPVPELFELLRNNASLYNINTTLFNIGLGEKPGEVEFTYYPNISIMSGRYADAEYEAQELKSFITAQETGELSDDDIDRLIETRLEARQFTCPIRTVSEIIREQNIEKIDLLKVDVEKSEINILQGIDENDWEKIEQVVLEVHEVDGELEWVTKTLKQQGFRVVAEQEDELSDTNFYTVWAISEKRESKTPLAESADEVSDRVWYDPEELIKDAREHLLARLPDYMVPARFMMIESLPITANGKLDRKELQKSSIDLQQVQSTHVPPSTETEKQLTAIWKELFKDREIGIRDDFFEQGGHSLKAAVLVTMIHKEMNADIPMVEIFNLNTIEEQARYIDAMQKTHFKSIEPAAAREHYPLSSAQKRMFILQQFDAANKNYNMPLVYSVNGIVDIGKIEAAFQQLIRDFDILRTGFEIVDGEPVQKIHRSLDFSIGLVKTAYSTEKNREEIDSLINDFVQPFNMAQPPLMRAQLIQLGEESSVSYLFCIDIHHIMLDGSSIFILLKEFLKLYTEESFELPRLHYKDYAVWQQNRLLEKNELQKQENYWLEKFKDGVPSLEMPTDFPRPAVQSFEGDRITFTIEEEETRRLKDLAGENNATLYMVLLSAYIILINRYTGQHDIAIGSGIADRPHADLQGMPGMFVNMVILRNKIAREQRYLDFLNAVKDEAIYSYENQDYQFDLLVEKIQARRDVSHNTLFDIGFISQNFELTDVQTDDFSFVPYEYHNKTSKFDIFLETWEIGDEIKCNLEYCSRLYRKDTMERLASHYVTILRDIISDPNIPIKEITILPEQEEKLLLHDFNDTGCEYPKDKTIAEIFEQMVDGNPGSTALNFKDTKLSYKELDEKTNQVARLLADKLAIIPDTPVGILMESSIEQIIAIMGIIKAGGAYVPIDTGFPEKRIKYILEDANISVILSSKHFIKKLNRLQWECPSFKTYLCLDSANIYEENEEENNELMKESLWNYIGEQAEDAIEGGGWQSSYTGVPMSTEEMNEYTENTLSKLAPYLHPKARVLEVGCASGLTMFPVAPSVGLYYGTDLSNSIIEKNKKRIAEEDISNIILETLPAHDIDSIQKKDFDIIIINSVIQCFHGHNYLRKIILKAIDLLSNEGILYIGDIMDQDLKEDLLVSLQDFKNENTGKGYRTKTDFSKELFVSRDFFEDMGMELNCITGLFFTKKIHTIENELTKYRYDAIIKIEKDYKGDKAQNRNKNQFGSASFEQLSKDRFSVSTQGDNLAYIIYTSGSTGNPRGSLIKHNGVINFVKNFKHFPITSRDTMLQSSNYAFDASVFNIFGALLNGSELVLIDKNSLLDVNNLCGIIRDKNISILLIPTALFNTVVEKDHSIFNTVNSVLVGGEKMSVSHVKRALESTGKNTIYNGYGPTEATVAVTCYQVNALDEGTAAIPIGNPLPNFSLYILDEYNRLQPIGTPGELCISGDGLSRGYLNSHELTAEKFVPNPFLPGEQMFKTGDLARWLPNGTIEFLGRIDNQVKIRGFRIEPGEIETVLKQHHGISDAVVTVNEISGYEKNLVAYIAPNFLVYLDTFEDDQELVNHESRKIPEFRIKYDSPCRVTLPDGSAFDTAIKDISYSGIGLFSKETVLMKGDRVTLVFKPPLHNETISIAAIVRHASHKKTGFLFEAGSVPMLLIKNAVNDFSAVRKKVKKYYEQITYRIPLNTPCTVNCETAGTAIPTAANDISYTGISFAGTPEDFKTGEAVSITIDLFENNPVSLEAEIVWHGEGTVGAAWKKENRERVASLVDEFIKLNGFSIEKLRDYLHETLPDYMVPALFVVVDDIPLTPNGKTDYRALKKIDTVVGTKEEFTAPVNKTEEDLLSICKEIFFLDSISTTDNFFDRGGNSLNLISIVSAVLDRFGVEIPLAHIFRSPTIKELAYFIDSEKEDKPAAAYSDTDHEAYQDICIPLHKTERKTLFCFPPVLGYGIIFKSMAAYLNNFDMYGFNYITAEDKINAYCDTILQIQSRGPYILVGYSAGGILAFRTAMELEKRGCKVSDIIMLDCYRKSLSGNTLDFIQKEKSEFEAELAERIKRDMVHEHLVEKTLANTKNYFDYILRDPEFKKINANIHLITSAESQRIVADRDDLQGWKELSNKSYRLYSGHGPHLDMLTNGNIEKNIRIIKEILLN